MRSGTPRSRAERVYPAPPRPSGTASSLLLADARLVAIDKAPGVSLATPRRAPEGAVERLLASLPAAERHRLGAPPLWLVHRLDVTTSGVVLLARDAESHRALTAAFAERRVGKTYLAVVWGHPRPREGEWDRPLGPDRSDRRRMRVDPEGRAARTAWRVVAVAPHVALVALAPRTGRTHQLRVHLAAAGHPIVGDDLYGGPRHRGVRDRTLRELLDPGRTLLHAWALALPSPPLPEPVEIAAPPPEDLQRVAAACGWAGVLATPPDFW
ncbi:MAG: RluA family pseudouridine synthase [Thermoanaerobaculia bacterium]|nr:RluA family pseudouridine synthase [Thermoanaerobaculia bacterium]